MPVIGSPIRIPFHLYDVDGGLVIDTVASNYSLRAALDTTELTLSAPDITIEQRAVGSSDMLMTYTPTSVGTLSIWGLSHVTYESNLYVSYIEITQYSTDAAIGRLALKAPLIGQDEVAGATITVYPSTDLEFSLNFLDEQGDPIDVTGNTYNFRVGKKDDDNASYITVYSEEAIASSQFVLDIVIDRLDTIKFEGETQLTYFVEEIVGVDRFPRAFADLRVVHIPKE